MDGETEIIEFLNDYPILEKWDIAYRIFLGVKEIENILLYEPGSVHLLVNKLILSSFLIPKFSRKLLLPKRLS
jgi:hypothetical protein